MLTRLRPLFDEFEAVVDSVNAFRDRLLPPVASFVLAPLLARSLTDIVASRYDAGIRLGHCVARVRR